MRKIVSAILLFAIVLTLSACGSEKTPEPLYVENGFTVYPEGDGIKVLLDGTKTNDVYKAVIYDKNREVKEVFGITLVEISDDDISKILGGRLDALTEKYGEYHTNAGIGKFVPAYFTADGYVFIFGLDDSGTAVISATKTDLFTDKNEFEYTFYE